MEPVTPRPGEPPSLAPDRFSARPGDPSAAITPSDPGAGPRPLPAEIVLPSDKILREFFDPWSYVNMVLYITGLAYGLTHDAWRLDGQEPMPPYKRAFPAIRVDASAAGDVVVRESEDLKPIDWSSFPVLVDGVEVCIDFGDWNIIRAGAADHAHWLRLQFHSSYKSYPWMGAFPAASYKDWAYYDRIQAEIIARRDWAGPLRVLNNLDPGVNFDSRMRRRFMVRGMLDYYFGDRVDFEWTKAPAWHAKAATALCLVQVPGSWENIMDKGPLQMMGLGLPVVSPVQYQQCCDGLLQPGVHYLACRQDYRDLPDQIRWLDEHRDEAAAIGRNAWLFFQEFCTPIAVWSYVKDRILHGARHARNTMEDDLCPPGLYKP